MKVLVLGATGFLGSAVVRAFQGGDVVAAARRPVTGGVVCDLADSAAVVQLLNAVGPDAVVNCAVMADFGEGVLDRLYPVNALAPAVIAGWAAADGAHVIQVSGTLVYGARTARIEAGTPLLPDTDYARSKLLADEMVVASGCRATIGRLGGIYGAGGPAHLGLNRAIDGARRGERPVLHGAGIGRRNYVHVDDAAAMLRHCVVEDVRGIHLAAGPETHSIAEMLAIVCDVFLPGQAPRQAEGGPGADQVVSHSAALLPGRPMAVAVGR